MMLQYEFGIPAVLEARLEETRRAVRETADEYLRNLGVRADTVVLYRGKRYTNLRTKYHNVLEHKPTLHGQLMKADGTLGLPVQLWDKFQIVEKAT